jgi:hypothetical protein
MGTGISPQARQGAAEALLTLPDGAVAAFEVTKLAADGALQTEGILASERHSWPLPGEWFWTIRSAPRRTFSASTTRIKTSS